MSSSMRLLTFFLAFFAFRSIANAKTTLRIGNIGSSENVAILETILNEAKKKMMIDGVIDDTFDIEILTVAGCGISFKGVAAAAKLYHVDNVDAFFGPFCGQELNVVAAMASFWNIPIFSYTSTAPELSDSKIYATLIQATFQSLISISEATSTFIAHQNWTKIAIISNIGADAFEKVQIMEKSLKKRGISISRRILIEETVTSAELIQNGVLDQLKDNSRVIIPIFSSNRKDLSSVFRNATILAEMSTNDFIFVYPMFSSHKFEPPVFFGPSALAKLKAEYAETIQIYDENGFGDELLTTFLANFQQRRFVIDENDLLNYVAIYQSFLIFAKFGKMFLSNRDLDSTATNRSIDGKQFRSFLKGKMIEGDNLESIKISDKAEVLRNLKVFYVDPKRENIRTIATINSAIDHQNGDELILSEIITNFWHSSTGKLPESEPACGFRNENCDYTKMILIGICLIFLMTIIAGITWIRRIVEDRALGKMSWRIYRDDIQILDEEQLKSLISMSSITTKMSHMKTNLIRNHAMIGVNTHSIFDVYEQRATINFQRSELIVLTRMKQAIHDNINRFIGISFNEKNELFLLWNYCSRGTLQDIVYCDKFEMDEKFHGSFVRDITHGIEYLHSSQIAYHGCLTSWAALIDKNWMVKLTDYAFNDTIRKWEKHRKIMGKIENESEQTWQRLGSLYVSPEIRSTNNLNKKQERNGKKWKNQSIFRRQAADIYAFGIIIYEILFRSLPFDEKCDLTELANKAAEGEKISRPSIQRNRKLNPDLMALLQDCWSDNPDQRPTIRRVRMSTESSLNTKGSLVDSMMKMMEEYANNLEKLVNERTKMAEEANFRAERLLFQLLPKNIAIDLKAGRSTPPKTYKSATVMFSDICGFTKLCSGSSPIEVVNLLNSIYSEFDNSINKFKAYKVETIGDAYMVVSGVPEENERRHVASIASIALEIIQLLKSFEIPHRKSERLVIRIGFASGPVSAAVISLNSPRYCLFGETVNIAAKMESSGEGGRIQMTEISKNMLEQEYPEYSIEIRGVNTSVNIPDFTTFWLINKDENYFKN